MKNLMISAFLATTIFAGVAFASPDSKSQTSSSLVQLQLIQTQVDWTKHSFKSVKLEPTTNGKYAVHVELTPSATAQLQKLTRDNVNHEINIVWNKQILSTSTIMSELGGKFLISGLLKKDAEQFVKSIQHEIKS